MAAKSLKIQDKMVPEIVTMLVEGRSPHYISCHFKVEIESVLDIFNSVDFSAKCMELFKNRAKGMALIAHSNIARIAFSPDSSEVTKLKASKILVDIAREMNDLHPSDLEPSNMSQSQLADRLKALQKEASNRAGPIDTGQIDQPRQPTLDDMLD